MVVLATALRWLGLAWPTRGFLHPGQPRCRVGEGQWWAPSSSEFQRCGVGVAGSAGWQAEFIFTTAPSMFFSERGIEIMGETSGHERKRCQAHTCRVPQRGCAQCANKESRTGLSQASSNVLQCGCDAVTQTKTSREAHDRAIRRGFDNRCSECHRVPTTPNQKTLCVRKPPKTPRKLPKTLRIRSKNQTVSSLLLQYFSK